MFDKAAAAFMEPRVVPAAGVALREFEDAVNGQESIFTRHPEHFELYQIAIYDDSNATFDCSSPPFILSNGSALKRSPL